MPNLVTALSGASTSALSRAGRTPAGRTPRRTPKNIGTGSGHSDSKGVDEAFDFEEIASTIEELREVVNRYRAGLIKLEVQHFSMEY